MSIANPLTASSDIQRASTSATRNAPQVTKPVSGFGEFASDIVKISSLGREKQQNGVQVEATRQIEKIANEVIRVSSTIGKARSVGNLSRQQATELYNKIASLL